MVRYGAKKRATRHKAFPTKSGSMPLKDKSSLFPRNDSIKLKKEDIGFAVGKR
ncbi:MAG: hypothetical protein Q8J68_13675 [Methanolobus sp.]|uniref:hypothetical protein n=1 Tax=Methanolobus sp. TaxID=1874737 RepID=UPI00272F54F5|nr:hypothetical protein [Methanolobus sp.]MDP2218322.1 hypothetical protein [Methanolobus sp.]